MVGRPSRTRALAIWMNGERVGEWRVSPAGHSLTYDETWLASPQCRPLSLSLPTAMHLHTSGVAAYFDNLLPDSDAIRKRAATRFGARSHDAFALLEKIGQDCVGAVQLLPANADAPRVRQIEAQPLSATQIAKLLDHTLAAQAFGMDDEEALRISVAGAQEKTALLWHESQWCRPQGATPTTHILKLPLGEVGGMRADFSTSVENEWLCAQIARGFGLPVAQCQMATFGRHKVLIVTRFDRRLLDGWWARLPQEDFCQVYGVPSSQKYEESGGPGIAAILDTLRGSEQAALDRSQFLGAQLLFWLLAAPDGHAKNFSLFIEPQGRFRRTPLYDVMSAWPVIGKGAQQFQWQKVKMAMAIQSRNRPYRMAEFQRRHWNSMARNNALGQDFEQVIEHFITHTPTVLDAVAANLPQKFPAAVSEPILNGIRTQIARLKQQGADAR